jgi:uncharacterized protein (TIGR02996 family)
LEHELRPAFEKIFREQPKVNSILLCVGQFWADEADDAVHDHLVVSSRWTPRWPHLCQSPEAGQVGDGELCSLCGPRDTWVVWDSNGLAIRAWQAFCDEGASQEDDPNVSFTPAVLARRTPTGCSLSIFGRVLRPWLDLPTTALPTYHATDSERPSDRPLATRSGEERVFREAIAANPDDEGPVHVYADWLLQRQDPLGEFLSLGLNKPVSEEAAARREMLQTESGEAWLLDLVNVLSPTASRFTRGVLTEAVVSFDGTTASVLDSPTWSTVERLTFSASSDTIYPSTLKHLRAVFGAASVVAMPSTVREVGAAAPLLLQLDEKQVRTVWARCDSESDRAALAALLERGFETVNVGFGPVHTWAERLQTPAHAELMKGALSVALKSVGDARGPQRVSVGGWCTAEQPTGWWVSRSRDAPDTASLRLEGLTAYSSQSFRKMILDQLKQCAVKRLLVSPSPLWRPSSEELAHMADGELQVVLEAEESEAKDPEPLQAPRLAPSADAVAIPMHVDAISRAVRFDAKPMENAPVPSKPLKLWESLLLLSLLCAGVVWLLRQYVAPKP